MTVLNRVVEDYEDDGWEDELFQLQHLISAVRKYGEKRLNERETIALVTALNDYGQALDGYPSQLQAALAEAGW